jgi:hypothetical protein
MVGGEGLMDPTGYLAPAYEILKIMKEAGYLDSNMSRVKRTFNYLVSGELQVAVFGAGGTGKSTLAELLLHSDPQLLNPKYNMSFELERKRIPGDISARFQVVPGQEGYIKTEWRKAFDAVKGARRALIFNVVANGYHTYGEQGRLTAIEAPKEFFSEDWKEHFANYVVERRIKEIDLLKVLCTQLETVKIPIRMTTVVTKEDLWWSEIEQVSAFYEGEYLHIIQSLNEKRQSKGLNFHHNFAPVSQVHANLDVFRLGERRVVKEISSGYDSALHLASVYRLLQQFDQQLKA